MRLSEDAKELYKLRLFRYRGQQCALTEVDLDKSHFESCCMVLHGVLCCVINANLSEREKQNTLHKLIGQKKLRKYKRIDFTKAI
ncbi:hypothetical protein CNEO4_220239 [Clostridium neonatale]|uniref:hypothetical protein n=1 Tax=Clostridium neonatale TaxID=137838 RepID=UPI00291C4235|nr:hypothetical protein [Clostridium neonatale]CAI3605343.1 hypothetical protein CNEO4_220239 [Clostridium neonatale]